MSSIRAAWCLFAIAAVSGVATDARAEIELPGTQPGDLDKELRDPDLCNNCHGDYAPFAFNDTWEGSMMANAQRDPLFLAALTIANQDAPSAGDLCLRCHTPAAWLDGRSKPFDGSSIRPDDDFEGVQCDVCHRMERPPEAQLSNAQYVIADDFARRGPLKDSIAPHDTKYSELFESSDMCGVCHDVSNPLFDDFPLERTYTEWKQSAFAREEDGETCQDCHMQVVRGPAAGARTAEDRPVHTHVMAGANVWMPRVIAGENPDRDPVPYELASRAAEEHLEEAATLELTAPERTRAGDALAFTVRVTNETGHKLPTSYPEGRQCWLEVKVTDADGRVLVHSGAYDTETGTRLDDPQLRVYEGHLGTAGEESFHFMLNDEWLLDSRIPPRGFRPSEETKPVGRDYPVQEDGTLANWDDAPYEVSVPADARAPLTIEATLRYRTLSRDYVEFLRDENVTDDRGQRMYDLWVKYDRSPPVDMASGETQVELTGARVSPGGGGCAAGGRAGAPGPPWLLAAIAALAWRARRR